MGKPVAGVKKIGKLLVKNKGDEAVAGMAKRLANKGTRSLADDISDPFLKESMKRAEKELAEEAAVQGTKQVAKEGLEEITEQGSKNATKPLTNKEIWNNMSKYEKAQYKVAARANRGAAIKTGAILTAGAGTVGTGVYGYSKARQGMTYIENKVQQAIDAATGKSGNGESLSKRITNLLGLEEGGVPDKIAEAAIENLPVAIGAYAIWKAQSLFSWIPFIGKPLALACSGVAIALAGVVAKGLYNKFNEKAASPPPSDQTLAQKTGLNLSQNKVAPSHQPNISKDHKVAANPATPERSPGAQNFNNQVSLASADRKVNNTPAPQHEPTTLGA